MSWVRIDDRICEHPKIAALPAAAFRLHIAAICYCGRNLTDGLLPTAAERALAKGNRRQRSQLIAAGLWKAVDWGYQIHDYLDYQDSREERLAAREATRRRVRKHRGGGVRNAVTPAPGNGVTKAAACEYLHGFCTESVRDLPREDPPQTAWLSETSPACNGVSNGAESKSREEKVQEAPSLEVSNDTLSSRLDRTEQIERVWSAYQSHHPRSRLTTERRALIRRRLKDFDADTLIAAIEGNHLDPHCCGQNASGATYHELDLILRKADKIERYAALHQPAGDGPRVDLAEALAIAARNGH